jgi:hypothetical protein
MGKSSAAHLAPERKIAVWNLAMPVGGRILGADTVRYYITLNQSSSRLKEYKLDYRRQKWLFLLVSDSQFHL